MQPRVGILALLLASAITPATAVESSCPYALSDLPDLEIGALTEAVFEADCPELREPFAERIGDLIAAGHMPDDADEEGMTFLALMTTGIRLNAALWRHDLNSSKELLADLQVQFDAMELAALAEDKMDGHAELDEEPPSAFLGEIAAVLAGVASRSPPQKLPSPESDWIVHKNKCGTGIMLFNLDGVAMPSRADAWVAVGAPEVGLQWLLADRWSDAISYGVAPPRLREFAERAFGVGAYESEIEHALASIRIDDAPGGRDAGMRLFGMWVPLPIGRQSWRDQDLKPFENEAEIVEFIRPILLPEADAAASDPG
jgi:hypothetical protein